jgi:hypothetical protein
MRRRDRKSYRVRKADVPKMAVSAFELPSSSERLMVEKGLRHSLP